MKKRNKSISLTGGRSSNTSRTTVDVMTIAAAMCDREGEREKI